jgi:hypothetical protein
MFGSTPHHVNITWTSCNRFLVLVFDKINRTTHGNSLLEGGSDVTDVIVVVTVRNFPNWKVVQTNIMDVTTAVIVQNFL